MEKWRDYYEKKPADRTGIYNVISLEFSHTKLHQFVQGPDVVTRFLDWIQYWPDRLTGPPLPGTEVVATTPLPPHLAKKKDILIYPKIQYYCLMGVAECFTDFRTRFKRNGRETNVFSRHFFFLSFLMS